MFRNDGVVCLGFSLDMVRMEISQDRIAGFLQTGLQMGNFARPRSDAVILIKERS